MVPWLLILLVGSVEANLSISVPRKAIDDPYIPFSVTCDFTSQSLNVETLVSITLSKKGTDDTGFSTLLTILATTAEVVEEHGFTGASSGHAQPKGGYSFLTAEYKTPSANEAGEYRCAIVGKDKDNNEVNLHQDEIITSSLKTNEGGYSGLVQNLELMQNRLDKLKEHTKECVKAPNYWFEAMRNITSLMSSLDGYVFGITEIFQDSFYVIIQSGLEYGLSKSKCRDYGGYLVEINTKDEMRFLRDSVGHLKMYGRNDDDFKGLLTGMYFPSKTGRFKFEAHPNNLNMYLGYWADSEPDRNDHKKNYIILKNKSAGLEMSDDKPNSEKWGAICEIDRNY